MKPFTVCGTGLGPVGGFGDERQKEELEQRLKGARLMTAEVLYYMPDHPSLLQTFLWQTLDEAPKYPRLNAFLDHWRREIEAVIHSVRVATGESLGPSVWRKVDGVFRVH
jgi:uncharacterized protein Usg